MVIYNLIRLALLRSEILVCKSFGGNCAALIINKLHKEKNWKLSGTNKSLIQFVLSTSTDINLFEFFARMANRIRSVPALFVALDEVFFYLFFELN